MDFVICLAGVVKELESSWDIIILDEIQELKEFLMKLLPRLALFLFEHLVFITVSIIKEFNYIYEGLR